MKDFGLPDIVSESEDGKRIYVTPEGNRYPSVTSVLSIHDKEGIERWVERVGEEKAEQVRNRAAQRGSIVHSLLERHVQGKGVSINDCDMFHYSLFLPIRNYLDQRMVEPWCLETPLYSDDLKTAGRVDLIAELSNGLNIIDFKTALREKKEEYIKSYFLQVAAYSYMFRERTGIDINNFCILIVDEYGTLQAFEGHTSDYIVDFAKVRRQYQQMYQI